MLPPQHVRVLIDRREIEKQQTGLEVLHRLAQHGELLFEHQPALRQILVPVDQACAVYGRILRNALRVERPNRRRHLAAVGCRSGERNLRSGRIEVDRRNVNLQDGMKLFCVDAKHATHGLDDRNQREPGADPAGPFVLLQNKHAVFGTEPRDGFKRIHRHGKVHRGLRVICAQRVRRSRDGQNHGAVLEAHFDDPSTSDVMSQFQRIIRKESKGTESSLQVRCAHAR